MTKRVDIERQLNLIKYLRQRVPKLSHKGIADYINMGVEGKGVTGEAVRRWATGQSRIGKQYARLLADQMGCSYEDLWDYLIAETDAEAFLATISPIEGSAIFGPPATEQEAEYRLEQIINWLPTLTYHGWMEIWQRLQEIMFERLLQLEQPTQPQFQESRLFAELEKFRIRQGWTMPQYIDWLVSQQFSPKAACRIAVGDHIPTDEELAHLKLPQSEDSSRFVDYEELLRLRDAPTGSIPSECDHSFV